MVVLWSCFWFSNGSCRFYGGFKDVPWTYVGLVSFPKALLALTKAAFGDSFFFAATC